MIELIQGDCFDKMQDLINKNIKANLILTDLPYGTTVCKWDNILPFKEMWDLIHKLTYDNSAILLFGSEPFSSYLRVSNINEYKYDIIWDKETRSGHLFAKKQPLRQYENISVFYKKHPTYNPIKWLGKEEIHDKKTTTVNTNVYNAHHGVPSEKTKWKYPTNIIKFNAKSGECNGQNRVHPTQKPVALLEYLIKTFSNENNLVLDFTMGSGSTGVACLQTNRNFIGIELDEKYYNIAKERCKNYQSKLI